MEVLLSERSLGCWRYQYQHLLLLVLLSDARLPSRSHQTIFLCCSNCTVWVRANLLLFTTSAPRPTATSSRPTRTHIGSSDYLGVRLGRRKIIAMALPDSLFRSRRVRALDKRSPQNPNPN